MIEQGTSEASGLRETRDGGLLVLTLDRVARRNALSRQLGLALASALECAACDATVRAVLLRGAGDYFCVGGDVDAMASGEPIDVPARTALLRQRMEAVRLLHEMPKPTIACVNGPAAGAGLALALACDIRVVSSSATLTTAFARIGVAGDYGCHYFLTHLVGTGKARELCFTAAKFSGEEAAAMGIASKAVPKDEVDAAARALASDLAAGPTAALASMKRNLNEAMRGNLADYLDAEARRQIESLQTADHREGVTAFREKRPPAFRGN